jgi:hypothetical protein
MVFVAAGLILGSDALGVGEFEPDSEMVMLFLEVWPWFSSPVRPESTQAADC